MTTTFFSLGVLLAFLGWWVLHLVVYKLWLGPIQTQRRMAAQGIKGPPYKFLHGTTKLVLRFINQSTESSTPGPSHHVFAQVQPHIHAWINTYGSVYLNWAGPEAELVVTEPELIKEILNNKNGAFKKIQPKGFVKKIFGDGLVTTEGGKWSKLRKLANHAFNGEILKDLVPEVVDTVYAMLETLKQSEGKEIEMSVVFKTAASEVISRMAFGSSYGEGKNIFEMLQQLTLLSSKNSLKIRFPGISKFWKSSDEVEGEKLERGIHDSILEIIKNREQKASVANANGEMDVFGNDYLGLLIKAWKDEEESNRITLDDLVDECKTFYLAGQDTTKSLLSWTIFLLALHPDWQDKARNEVVSIFGQQGQPNYQGLAKLKTMTMIINESLRLYPPVLSITRKTDRPTKLGSLVLPPNMKIFIPNLKLQYDPQIWGDDVHLFKPERFADGVAKATKNNMAVFLPFGMGPRHCVGNNFATTEAKVVISMILQQYSFALSPAYVHAPSRSAPIIRPLHGLHMIFHPLCLSNKV